MYFGTRSYPWIRALPKSEQKAAMAAIYQKDRWCKWRFFIVLGVLIGSAILVGRFVDSAGVKGWFPLVVGAVFFLYLLWEINGPLFQAAEQHFGTLQDRVSDKTRKTRAAKLAA